MHRRFDHTGSSRRLRRSAAGALALCATALIPGIAAAQALNPAGLPTPLDPAGADTLAPLPDLGAVPPANADAPAPAAGTLPLTPDEGARKPAVGQNGKITLRAGSTAKLRQGPPPLPPLEAYVRSLTLRGTRTEGTAIGVVPPAPPVFGPTVAALPAPPALRRPRADPEPFAPVGYSLGSFTAKPYVEESFGYDSNPDQIATKVRPSAFNRTEGGFDLLSLWSSNELKATMHAGYNTFFSNPDADRPDASGIVDYRLDATRDLTFDTEGRFTVTTQRPGSPEVNAAVVGRPLVTTYGATIGGDDTLGRLTLGLHGLFDRNSYDNGRLSDGTVVVLDDQNYNDYGIVARAAYEWLPTIKPFVQLTVDTRVHDRRLDVSGYARDSDGIVGQAGSTFEITHLLTGSLSAGYEDRTYSDKRLRDLAGPVIDASLSYAITPLTTLAFNANTSFNETDVLGSSGSESRSFSLQATHALLRNLSLTAIAGYTNTDYIGSSIVENTYSGTLKASYSVSRSILLDASYNHQTLKSSVPASSYGQDVVMLGVRLQH